MTHRWLIVFFFLTSGLMGLPPVSDAELTVISEMGLSPIKGAPALIDFEFKDLAGATVHLSSLKGKVILLNFWATWCPPCRQEMPSIERLFQSLRGNQDFALVAVDLQEEPDVVKAFAKKNGYHFPIYVDLNGAASGPYSLQAIPTTYLIDRSGRVVAGVQGAHVWDSAATRRGLEKLLKLVP